MIKQILAILTITLMFTGCILTKECSLVDQPTGLSKFSGVWVSDSGDTLIIENTCFALNGQGNCLDPDVVQNEERFWDYNMYNGYSTFMLLNNSQIHLKLDNGTLLVIAAYTTHISKYSFEEK